MSDSARSAYSQRAAAFVDMMRGITVYPVRDYSMESVANLERWIRDSFDPPGSQQPPDELVADIASFIGEVIIRNIGGHWSCSRAGEINAVGKINAVFPLLKVRKRFANGPEDSLEHYISVLQQYQE